MSQSNPAKRIRADTIFITRISPVTSRVHGEPAPAYPETTSENRRGWKQTSRRLAVSHGLKDRSFPPISGERRGKGRRWKAGIGRFRNTESTAIMRQHSPAYGEKRHLLAIERTVCWAEEAAAAGEVKEALAWLRVIEAVEGLMPHRLLPLLQDCLIRLEQVETRLELPTAA